MPADLTIHSAHSSAVSAGSIVARLFQGRLFSMSSHDVILRENALLPKNL